MMGEGLKPCPFCGHDASVFWGMRSSESSLFELQCEHGAAAVASMRDKRLEPPGNRR